MSMINFKKALSTVALAFSIILMTAIIPATNYFTGSDAHAHCSATHPHHCISPPLAAKAYFKNPFGWSGTGCNAQSVTVGGSNSSKLIVLFDAYEAGEKSLGGLVSRSCSFTVPVIVPKGLRMTRLTVNWNGSTSGIGTLRRRFKLTGSDIVLAPSYRDLKWRLDWFYFFKGERSFSRPDTLYNSSKGGCGGSKSMLKIQSRIKAMNTQHMAGRSYIAIDTTDRKGSIVLRLYFQPC